MLERGSGEHVLFQKAQESVLMLERGSTERALFQKAQESVFMLERGSTERALFQKALVSMLVQDRGCLGGGAIGTDGTCRLPTMPKGQRRLAGWSLGLHGTLEMAAAEEIAVCHAQVVRWLEPCLQQFGTQGH